MRHDILFTVISPLYAGHNEYVKDAYASLLRQTYPWWEWCIAINNGGVLPEYIRSDPRVRAFDAPPECGRNISRLKQACVDRGRGDVVVVLDADDMFTDEALELAARAYWEHPWAEAVIGSELFFIEPGCEHLHREALRCLPDDWVTYKGKLWPIRYNLQWTRGNILRGFPAHFLSIKRSVFDLVGGYNYSMHHADDVGLCTRLVQMGVREYGIREPMYINRWHRQFQLHVNIRNIVLEAANIYFMASREWVPNRKPRGLRWLEV